MEWKMATRELMGSEVPWARMYVEWGCVWANFGCNLKKMCTISSRIVARYCCVPIRGSWFMHYTLGLVWLWQESMFIAICSLSQDNGGDTNKSSFVIASSTTRAAAANQ